MTVHQVEHPAVSPGQAYHISTSSARALPTTFDSLHVVHEIHEPVGRQLHYLSSCAAATVATV